MNITSISTQGKPYTSEYVQEFRIEFGYDGQDFAPYRDKFGNFKVCNEHITSLGFTIHTLWTNL